MEISEVVRRCKRFFDGYTVTRRTFLLLIVIFGLLLYLGPPTFRWLLKATPIMIDPNIGCVSKLLEPYVKDENHFDATIFRSYDQEEASFLPYVGNGKFGLPVANDSPFYVFHKRSLTLPIWFQPIVKAELWGANSQEGTVMHLTQGIVHKFQCFNKHRKTVSISNMFYSHRVIPSLFVQEIKINNPLDEAVTITLHHAAFGRHPFKTEQFSMQQENEVIPYSLILDGVRIPETGSEKFVAVAIAFPKLPDSLRVEPRKTVTHVVRSAVQYSMPLDGSHYKDEYVRLQEAIHKDLQQAFQLQPEALRERHVNVWRQLWDTGFGISYSKAQSVLNGDKINATLYYVLSNTRAYLSEYGISPSLRQELNSILSFPDRCYGDHQPTLRADRLWHDLSTIEQVNSLVSIWLLTLDKKGCHKLLKAGAQGVIQAMVLSFGALMFNTHHLEFNTNPRDLHRDYFFRRIEYGNATHINISVIVGEDNKAVIYTSLDDNDKDYYACDGGCLDPPVKLQQVPVQFPVKVTEPLTAILYITSNFQHMEELKHVIHVKGIDEAPAHEHHILALHRHGHQLGGLPALFWVSIVFLIVVFHLFLAKLIYNEYCGNQDKSRGRYVV